MKRHLLIIIGVLLAAATLISFRLLTNNDNKPMPTNPYEKLWKQFNEHLENDLPESAGKTLDQIEQKAVKDGDQVQLLKSFLYRRKVMFTTVEDDSDQAWLEYALAQLDRLDTVPQAVLHCEIACIYAEYLDDNLSSINDNIAIDGDLNGVEMKYWDKKTFERLIDEHFSLALQPIPQLKAVNSKDYLTLYERPDPYYLRFEPTMFDFLFHRVTNHYRNNADADDLDPEWDTQLWWLADMEFAKADLGDSDNAIIRCLRIFQQLINENRDNENLLLYNDYKRYSFVNGIIKEHALYQQAIQSLRERYRDNEQYSNLSAELAGNLIEQYREFPNDSAYYDNYQRAAAICREGIEAYPKHCYDCKHTLEYLQSPDLHFSFNEVQLPNENIPVVMEYRNLRSPYYKIVKVTEKDLKKMDNLYGQELMATLRKKSAHKDGIVTIPEETDLLSHSAIVALPPLEEGFYYLLATPNKETTDDDKTIVLFFQVSNLGFITDSKSDQLEVVTIDRKTGHPMEGVTVEAFRKTYNYEKHEYQTKTVATKKSDGNGRVVFDQTTGYDSFLINLRKGNDVLLAKNNQYVERPSDPSGGFNNTHLFTDRAIYRPGQTVYFKGIVEHVERGQHTVVTHYQENIRFKDANWQTIATADFTTDEYGAFSGSFVIPTDLLNGNFQLSGKHGNAYFKVEEYKRPTFEINFESVKEQYKLNQDVTVRGSVDALAGFGLDDVKYSYRVVRKTSFPWRCWWWWYPPVEDEQIAYGEARTDTEGKFAVTFNLKPSLKTKPEKQPVFTYEIEITATSAQGETHSSTHSLRAGYNQVALSTNLPNLVEQTDLGKYRIEVINMNGQPAKSRVARKIYRFDDEARINYFEAFKRDADIDRKLYSDEELERLFPNYCFTTSDDMMQHKTLVYEDEIVIDGETVCYQGKKSLQPGVYYIELKSLDDPLAQTATSFTVYRDGAKQLPSTEMAWYQVQSNTCHPGETFRFNIGSSAHNVKVWVKLKHKEEVRLERWITLDDNIQEISYKVTEADRGGLTLTTAFVKENSYQLSNRHVFVPYDNLDLDVSLATVRDKLNPGGEETWTVNVKDYQGKPLEAALLAGMYDASLEEFAHHYWNFSLSPIDVWGSSFLSDNHRFISSSIVGMEFVVIGLFNFELPSDYPFFQLYSYHRFYRMDRGRKSRMLFDVLYEDAGVPEVASAKNMASAEESVEKESYSSDNDDEAAPTSGEAPKANEEVEPSLRENFNETAFFFPDLRTEADGSCTFSFTMPDAITRWRLMMISHTKDSKTGYKEYTFKSSKPVMIMADMPRYMYDTDELWMVANVINTGDEAVTPKAKLEIFDAATMKPVNLIKGDAVIPMKEIVPGRSQEVRWKVAAKYDLGLLAFRFTAYAGAFSDAEQHLMPVLSSEIFLTQTLPITVKAETEKTFDFEAIANPESHERDYSLTLNFSTNPVWYAVQSLPYLANIKTDRPENAFYVFYANSLSAYIADHVPNLMAYIKKWQIETPDALLSQLEKDQDLKAIMLKETPWVLEAKSETEQRARIANLFELNTLRQQQSATLTLLEKKQKSSGGWPWVDGMPESPYITTYILTGFGKLKDLGVWESMSPADQKKAENICKKAVKYVEYDIADTYRTMKRLKKEWGIGSYTLHELYALSFFDEQKSDRDFAKAKAYFLDRLGKKKEWTGFDFNQRSFAALVLYRTGNQKDAKLIIQSFKECAQKNEEIGMYWPKKYFSFTSHIATHANIMSAFAEIEGDQEMLDQLRVWLLTQKRTNMWENSSSTADAIYALLLRGSDWFEEGKDVTLRFGGTPISTDGGEAGTGFIQRHWNANEVTDDMRHLTVNNPTQHLVWGGLFRQYFVPIDEVKADESGFKIKRELFVETVTANGKLLVPVEKRTLKVGDKLTVKITIESSQDMSFVFVKDLRAAGFEPLEQISRYEYGDGIHYYQSNTDTDMEFFIDFLPKGTHQLEYSLFVTKQGHLSNGYALVQCQYAPEFTAYSSGMRVTVE